MRHVILTGCRYRFHNRVWLHPSSDHGRSAVPNARYNIRNAKHRTRFPLGRGPIFRSSPEIARPKPTEPPPSTRRASCPQTAAGRFSKCRLFYIQEPFFVLFRGSSAVVRGIPAPIPFRFSVRERRGLRAGQHGGIRECASHRQEDRWCRPNVLAITVPVTF